MIHSILITNSNSEERKTKAFLMAANFLGKPVTNNPDFLFLEDTQSLKIAQVRELQHQLALKPYLSPFKVVLINEADKLTLPAQHALLKTLEEPPEKSIIILTALNKETLLPTIISRCQIIQLAVKKSFLDQNIVNSSFSIIHSVLSATPGQRLLWVEKTIYNRDQAFEFCQNQLEAWRRLILIKTGILKEEKTPDLISLSLLEITKTIRQIESSLRLLKANVNPNIVAGNLLLSYPF